jgi:uncharacterized protein (DUF608 family)
MAGPFTRKDFERLVPADKKLRPEWVRSLTARGRRAVYSGDELERIGMPVGGICAGQLYLGGDGTLWHWDIFNQPMSTGDSHYAHPVKPSSPLDQGFMVRVTGEGGGQERRLDAAHWRQVSFTGEYPIGFVEYRDRDSPVSVSLEAFSPFIPLSTDDSSLPLTVLEFTVKNESSRSVQAELAGWLENAVCLQSGKEREGLRRNRVVRRDGTLRLECSAGAAHQQRARSRPDVVFDDFEHGTYSNWKVSGTAFGTGPVKASRMPDYQGDVHAQGQWLVNSHASAPGNSVTEKDSATGRLVSRSFTIERDYITFLIGGGAHKGATCMNLVVGNEVVRTATGPNSNELHPMSWDVRHWVGQTGRLEILDQVSGAWGNIGVDDIVFSDRPRQPAGPLEEAADFGTLVLALLDAGPDDIGIAALPAGAVETAVFSDTGSPPASAEKPFGDKLLGALRRPMRLEPGASATATFLLAWHMPNLSLERLPPGRFYATRFHSAVEVAAYAAKEFDRLRDQTRRWHRTWYDSTLPYWFLDRAFLSASTLATSTCHRLGNGRFYGWEGVGCCAGTCDHVWHYAHAVARLFPELERGTREKVDFGLALQPDGAIHFRAEFNNIPAVDGQAGCILRALREHEMSADDSFLRRNWPQIRRATEWLIAKDANNDGIIESNQHNTLDTDWYGAVPWLSGLYLAAVAAAEQMALETGDTSFADRCSAILQAGQKNLLARLFDDGYFVSRPDPKHLDAINSGTGCEVDQVFGQSWAFQVGLPRVLPRAETVSALNSLWRYNFTPDVGPYRKAYKAGRWYAMPGEAGLLMCTFPRTDWDYAQAKGKGPDWAAGYFDECMNGFEYQVAGHMLWEGLTTEGLAIIRAVHDRYHPARRNPWNEVECGDHYARSMASYGVYLAACGFEYHGPKAHLGFAPRLGPEKFRAAFTAAEGWGTFAQETAAQGFQCRLALHWGRLRLKTLALDTGTATPAGLRVRLDQQPLPATLARDGSRVVVSLDSTLALQVGQSLEITFSRDGHRR